MRFFKILTPFQTTTLTFPPVFNTNHASELSNTVTISLPDGRKWRIGTRIDGLYVGLHNNLREFLEYYSIDEGFCIFFWYKGDSSFEAQIYDRTSCEIEYPQYSVLSSDKEVEYPQYSAVSSNKGVEYLGIRRNPRRPGLRFRDPPPDQGPELDTVTIEDADSSEWIDSESSERGSLKQQPKRIPKDWETNKDLRKTESMKRKQKSVKIDSDTDSGSDQNPGIKLRKKKSFERNSKCNCGSSSTPKSGKNLGKESFNMNPETENDSTEKQGKKRRGKRPDMDSRITDGAGRRNRDNEIVVCRNFFSHSSSKDAFQLARELNLTNPSFLIVLEQHVIDDAYLYVPAKFVGKGLGGKSKMLDLVDPQGRMWVLQLHRHRAAGCLRGLRGFMQANCLKAGDLCVFELIKDGLKLWVIDGVNV